MINDPAADQTATRQPRLQILTDGAPLPGAVSASVTTCNYYQADTFQASFAMSAGAPGWWDRDPPWLVDVQASLDGGNSWQSLIIGEIDHVQPHFQTGLLEVEGRDLSARLIEEKTQESFANQTSSQVATTLAGRHGLTPVVTATTTLVGRYYESDHIQIGLGQFSRTTTEWDLLIFLAQREGFDVFVSGSELHFQPTAADNSDPFVIQWTPPTAKSPVPRLNAVTLHVERSLLLAKDIQVDVRSWNSASGRGFTRSAKGIGALAAAAAGVRSNATQRHVYVLPNLTEADAQAEANRLARELSLHERVVNVEMPGDLTLKAQQIAKLIGTGTSFDQKYWIDRITRSISFEDGFRASIRMKNSSPRNMTQAS